MIATSGERKLIWDLPVRVFHWALVVLIPYSWYCVEVAEDMDRHMLTGYVILALVMFRLAWGIIGPRYARFASFLFSPARILAYLRAARDDRDEGRGAVYAGHNPLGSLSVFALLGVLSLQVSTGLFSSDEYSYFGPLAGLVSEDLSYEITTFHHLNFKVIAALAALHIVAVFYYLLGRKENLIVPMVTGYKRDGEGGMVPIAGSRLVVAALTMAACAAAVCFIVGIGE
ncbi:MAG: cytochrome b/b6 domain-containing protein [Gammaproteobacteria bacterium]|nr:cytochrome b/b6 domain-containing protein [Gammaproteobacteria bacterium]